MDNIRAVISILFGRVSEQDILSQKISYKNIPLQDFTSLANSYIVRYTNDEIRNLYSYLKTELKWMRHKIYYEEDDGKTIDINVFDVLYLFSDKVLTQENNQPVCQYLHFLRWHEMTKEIGEDSLITSYLAFQDARFGKDRQDFYWRPVIGHNSRALNQIMEKGLAENHFHLKGSAPLFHISWICMMNRIADSVIEAELLKYDVRRLRRNVAYQGGYQENSLYVLCLRVAYIRMYLYMKVTKQERAEDLLRYIGSLPDLLRGIDELTGKIAYHQEYNQNEYDYADINGKKSVNRTNGILNGERWLLYQMFYGIYSKSEKYDSNTCQLFYYYLLIKNIIRAEFIQVNDNIGFDNFLEYQDRKDKIIENTIYEPVYVRMAVRDTLSNQHISKLEARIVPKDTAEENCENIQRLNHWIMGNEDDKNYEKMKQKMKKHFYYVMHFIKQRESEEERYVVGTCRDCSLRYKIEQQAKALVQFRENKPEVAKWIRGIDASSAEIWCRPEIFAQVFRYLKSNQSSKEVPQLRCSYHVGEDFLDIVDGLRAIDEAILYLNLRCGDRIGHALALGVDVDVWYRGKANLLLIDRMSHLDNLAWLYQKIRKYHIRDCEDAVYTIRKRYDELIKIVYKQPLNDNQHVFSIDSYYDAWKLRGDNPENYKNGQFLVENLYADEWEYYSVNREFPRDYRIRYDKETAYLYYLYHYNNDVKKLGDEMMEVPVDPSIVRAVKQVQNRMQIEICERGIGIETNPSSNCAIGSFKRYDLHPIRQWFNYGLTSDQEEQDACPQLMVSINTDDQGVFNTCLENEYAYLALALEKLKNEDGTPKYKRTLILRWLDNIRELGLGMSFLSDVNANG